MSSPSRAYRDLLRAVSSSFRGDAVALRSGRAQARAAFAAHASEAEPARLGALLAEAADAASFLREHIVQAALNDAGRYALKLNEAHGDAGGEVKVQHAAGAAVAGGEGGGAGGCCGGGCR